METLSARQATPRPALKERLFAATDIASLAFFRISLGLIFFAEVVRYFAYGWIREDFIAPQMHFTYFGFGWITPWPGWGMYAHFIVMGIAAIGLTLGCFYQFSAILCFLCFTYVFLLDQALYLNHFYLMCLLAFLAIFLPLHRAASIDACRKPGTRTDVLPAWPRILLISFISLVYAYAGVAKLNFDWFSGGALRVWLAQAEEIPLLGPHLNHKLAVYAFAYGGLAFDLLIVPLLLWRRTRVFGYLWALAFHSLNFLIFSIGVFPWLMILATTIYFRPDWPRRLFRWRPSGQVATLNYSPTPLRLGAAFLILQALIPLRHLAYPGHANWNEAGHRFSWHMMLRSKSGKATFVVTDPVKNESWTVDPRDYLTDQQTRKSATRPDMLLQFAHYLAKHEAATRKITNRLEVRVISSVSLDGRRPQPMVYYDVDLARVRRHLGHNDWVTPLIGKDPATPEQIARIKNVPRPPRKDRPNDIQTPATAISPEQLAAILAGNPALPPAPASNNVRPRTNSPAK
jgi:vitamin K-dependent gamma-carboxylase